MSDSQDILFERNSATEVLFFSARVMSLDRSGEEGTCSTHLTPGSLMGARLEWRPGGFPFVGQGRGESGGVKKIGKNCENNNSRSSPRSRSHQVMVMLPKPSPTYGCRREAIVQVRPLSPPTILQKLSTKKQQIICSMFFGKMISLSCFGLRQYSLSRLRNPSPNISLPNMEASPPKHYPHQI